MPVGPADGELDLADGAIISQQGEEELYDADVDSDPDEGPIVVMGHSRSAVDSQVTSHHEEAPALEPQTSLAFAMYHAS